MMNEVIQFGVIYMQIEYGLIEFDTVSLQVLLTLAVQMISYSMV